MEIRGLHHVTMTARDAQRTVDFYTRVLGLRLVKQTVNIDDTGSYHLYVGDEEGRPGTLLTFFERPGMAPGREGIGGTHHLALAAENEEALLRWKRWLTDGGVPVAGVYDRVYFKSIYFRDPDGLILEIATRGPGWTVDEPAESLGGRVVLPPFATTAEGRDEGGIAARTWPEPVGEISREMRLAGLHHVTAIASDVERTRAFYEERLGLRIVKRTINFDDPSAPHLYLGAGDGRPGTVVTYFGYAPGRMPRFAMGTGVAHHFALEVADEEALLGRREALNTAGVRTTEVRDRKYFKSIYLQDPDGHILEIATAGPGFFVDEDRASAGTSLQLPPGLEPHREEIAGGLTVLRV